MKADHFLVNGRVVNVYSGEILEQNIAVKGDTIVYVGTSRHLIGSNTRVIDCRENTVVPGYFDPHAHADLFCNPWSYCDFVVTRGTTAMFNDGHDLANALGPNTYLKLMNRMDRSPVCFYTGVPAASPPYPGPEGEELWTEQDLESAFHLDTVIALSEITPFPRILSGDPTLMKKLSLARLHHRLIEGHTTGANPDKLNILALAGVTSCHESLTSQDVIDRVRLGYYVMLRHGSIRKELQRLNTAVHTLESYDLSRVMLTTDGIFPDHLMEWGNMDWVAAQAVAHGIDPVRAIQMATLNPARYFRLDHLLGGIAPGRLANLQLVENLEAPTPYWVMAKGRAVAENGKLIIESSADSGIPAGDRPFTIGYLEPDTFRVPVRGSSAAVPVITVVNQTVTGRQDINIDINKGFYSPQGDILNIFLISRDGSRMGKGFVKGFGKSIDGVATTVAHETHGLMVLGQDKNDMAMAAQEVLNMNGGMVLVMNGRVVCTLALPFGGIASAKAVPELAREIKTFNASLKELGCPGDYPVWTMGFLSFTSVLRFRITYDGVYDVKERRIIF